MLLPGLIVVLIYNYGPMGGLIMAWKFQAVVCLSGY